VDNQRNMILAIVLSALVLLGWSALSDKYFPQPKPGVAVPGAPAAPMVPTAGAPTAAAPATLRDASAVIAEGGRVAIKTPRLTGSLNLKGARIDDLVLSTYHETIKKGSPNVRLLAPQGSKEAYFAGFGWTGEGAALPNANTVWTADQTSLTPATPVTLSWDNGTGQTFQIKIAVDDIYMFTVDQSVTNAGGGAVAVRPYAFVTRDEASKDPSVWTNHLGPVGVFDGAANYKVDYTDLDEPEGAVRKSSTGGWIGFGDKYWLTALAPAKDAKIDAGFKAGGGMYQADYFLPQALIAPGSVSKVSTHFFAGAKEVKTLDTYQDGLGITHLGKAIDWGWFEVIEKPMFKLLDWLFHLVGNFGVAIIMLTFIVRGVMFPIAQKQFANMASMRAVQPKLKALQDRYKDDKPKLQQEMMELYKKEKINPMAGCLPVFLQIPIFYALYKVLVLTIEMRHQPFALWLHDLSAPDPSAILKGFGMIDYPLPAFLAIGILPVLMGVTMYMQFKLNPAPPDPVQAQVFSIMPWIMMFVMGQFAAGLVLYWTVSNILTIAQQKWLYSKHPALQVPVKT
jgi:YidC/Oxa1 family membrane protein insertase